MKLASLLLCLTGIALLVLLLGYESFAFIQDTWVPARSVDEETRRFDALMRLLTVAMPLGVALGVSGFIGLTFSEDRR